MNFTELVALCHMSCIFISRTISLIVSHRDHSHSIVLTRIQKFSMIYSYGTLPNSMCFPNGSFDVGRVFLLIYFEMAALAGQA